MAINIIDRSGENGFCITKRHTLERISGDDISQECIKIHSLKDFNLFDIFDCGQCFRWNKDKNGDYVGIAFGKALRVKQEGDSFVFSCSIKDFETIWFDYFDLGRDYGVIRKQLNINDFMRKATNFGAGIRILQQSKWEALCSFVISQNNHIPRIKKIVEGLSKKFGEPFKLGDKTYYSFPTPESLSRLDEADLAELKCGYRASYIIGAARSIAGGELDLEALSQTSIEHARKELLKIRGIGKKVADCVILFGLGFLDSFPIDVWMKRALAEHFEPDFDPIEFSPYAGIAQQYIFHYARNSR